MPFLRRSLLTLRFSHAPATQNGFPFTVSALQHLIILDLSAPVTFFIGENGSGKSTVLESLALAAHLLTAGNESVDGDPTLRALRPLAKCLKLVWSKKAVRGFFLRAEDFFGFAKRQTHRKAEMEQDIEDMHGKTMRQLCRHSSCAAGCTMWMGICTSLRKDRLCLSRLKRSLITIFMHPGYNGGVTRQRSCQRWSHNSFKNSKI